MTDRLRHITVWKCRLCGRETACLVKVVTTIARNEETDETVYRDTGICSDCNDCEEQ